MCGSACSHTVPPWGVNLNEFSSKFEMTRSSFGESKGSMGNLALARKYRASAFSWNLPDQILQIPGEGARSLFPGICRIWSGRFQEKALALYFLESAGPDPANFR